MFSLFLCSRRGRTRAPLITCRVWSAQREVGEKKSESCAWCPSPYHFGLKAKPTESLCRCVFLLFVARSHHSSPHTMGTAGSKPAPRELVEACTTLDDGGITEIASLFRKASNGAPCCVRAWCFFLEPKKRGKTPTQHKCLLVVSCSLLPPPLTTGGGARAELVSPALPPKDLARVIANDQVRDPCVYTLVQSVPCSRRRRQHVFTFSLWI